MTSEASYALSVLSGGTGAESIRSDIFYGLEADAPDDACVIIEPSGFFDEPSMPEPPFFEIDGMPILFGEPSVRKFEHNGQRRLVLKADLVASAFFLLTRYEEILRRETRDDHGRFPGSESLAVRAGFIQRPLVDEYANWIATSVCELTDQPAPLGNPALTYRVVLTHDVDLPFRFATPLKALYGAARMAFRRPAQSWHPIAAYLNQARDPVNYFDFLQSVDGDLRKKLGTNRVDIIYFMMASRNGPHDGNYRIEAKRIRALMEQLRQSGARIGLHPSYRAGETANDQIAVEKLRLERACGHPVSDTRHHYLRWREPEDVEAIEKAGFTDDYSMGFADVIGFRIGTCRPVRFYDALRGRLTAVTVHPLAIMEVTLSDPTYMGLDEDGARREAFKVLAAIKQHGGEACLLWHNHIFETGRSQIDQAQLYKDCLAFLSS